MTDVLDIDCPACGSPSDVRKVAIGAYRCTECDTEFTAADVHRS